MSKPRFHCVQLHCSIFEQLQLEEALVRADTRNWLLFNWGSPPAIVLGISGKIDKLVNTEMAEVLHIPLMRRFSGGGTVVVDPSTVFVTLIGQHSVLPFPVFPCPLMRWTGTFYSQAVSGATLRENDYVLGEKKFGGNAQYLTKDRWLHHSSLLWNYSPEKMDCLLQPERTPTYRQGRSHCDFITTLNKLFASPEDLQKSLADAFGGALDLVDVAATDAWSVAELPHRKSVRWIAEEEKSLR